MAFGFKPARMRDGSPYNGAAQRASYITGADLYIGDPVVLSGTADAAGVLGVSKAADTGNIYGIVVGFEPIRTDLSANYITSAQATGDGAYVLVATDPNVVYHVTEDGTGGFLAATSVGLNTNYAAGTPDTTFGTSGALLDSSDADVTAALQFKIVGLAQTPDNAFGTTDTIWEVTINASNAAPNAVGI